MSTSTVRIPVGFEKIILSDFEFTPATGQFEKSNIYRFMQKCNVSSINELSKKAEQNLEWFWESVEKDIGIVWNEPYTATLDVSEGIQWSKWFVNGKTNIYTSSVRRFAESDPDRTAFHFVSEDGHDSSISYGELDREVCRLANGLKSLGVGVGDIVAVYSPMIREAILMILAAAKIGAVQTVIFSGYGADALHVRLEDCKAKVLLISDGFERKGRPVSQKSSVESAIKDTSVEKIIVVPYKGIDKYEESDRVISYDTLVSSQNHSCDTAILDSEDSLFILYTSGTTGRPKGTVHTHGGFSVFAGHQSAYLLDTKQHDILLWPADIGWITGLVWNVYGLLLTGACAVIYDGALDYPSPERIWKMLSFYRATIFGISPTAVRLYKKERVEPLKLFPNYHIRNIATTGEPLDEDSWRWLFEKVGNRKIPITNLSGGTEIGGAMLSVFPGMRLKPSTVGVPVPGMNLDIFDDDQKPVREGNGYLVIKSPWPAMTRGLLNDDAKYLETYWSRFENVWFHGDYVSVDDDDLWYMRGRTDDIINVSGHRMSTAEIEHAVISHDRVSDAASVAVPDDITGDAIVIFVVSEESGDVLPESLISEHISETLGKVARPKHVFQLSDLPRTRTGKILRRLLKSRLLGTESGDLSSLENPAILDEISRLG